MRMIAIFGLASLASATLATSSFAQQRTMPGSEPWSPPPGVGAGIPLSGYNSDLWTNMALKKSDEYALKIVDQQGWSRARQAAAAINRGECGEAAVIAAKANDSRLMEGVKRACKAV